MYKLLLKRVFDLIIALGGILILSIPFLIILLIQLIVFNGRPFFTQSRAGYKGREFSILKFRTMYENPDGNTGEECRIGKWGLFLRRRSLDEIPQLLNVLKGELSIVGPRPLLAEYLSLYNEQEKKRHDVKPGITGLAQVKGRNTLSWQQKFRYDIFYVKNSCFLMDLKILLLTITKVLFPSGEEHVIPQKFTGSKQHEL